MHTLTRSTIQLCRVAVLSGTVGGLVQVTVNIHDLSAAGNESDGWLRDFGKVISVWPSMTVVFAVFSQSLCALTGLAACSCCLCPCVKYMPSGLLVDVTQLSITTSAILFCTEYDVCHLV